jgi:hypothetical protein
MTVPARMTVIAIRAPGGPEMWCRRSAQCRRPGPATILVKVAAAGVNRPDVRQRQGTYPPPEGREPTSPALRWYPRANGQSDQMRKPQNIVPGDVKRWEALAATYLRSLLSVLLCQGPGSAATRQYWPGRQLVNT